MSDKEPTTFEDAEAELTTAVYEATQLIERLERKGLVLANCHHVRQDIARYAVEKLKQHWVAK